MQSIMFIALVVYAGFTIVIQCCNMQINNQTFIVIHNMKITSKLTSLEVRKVRSRIVCAGLCVDHSSCCSVSYDLQTSECMLDSNCFPERAIWQNVTFLHNSANVTTSIQPSQNDHTNCETTKEKTNAETTNTEITRNETTSFETTRDIASGETTTTEMIGGETTSVEKTTRDIASGETIATEITRGETTTREITSAVTTSVEKTTRDIVNGETTTKEITRGETSVEKTTRDIASGETTTMEITSGETTTREMARYDTTKDDSYSYDITKEDSYSYDTTKDESYSYDTTKADSYSYDTTIYRTSFETTKDKTDIENTASGETINDNTSNATGDDTSKETDEEIHNGSTDEIGCQNYDTTTPNQVYITGNFSDCSEIPSGSPSGVYIIYVEEKPVDVYCEMTDYGQWTVIQRRLNGTTDFYRNWQDYKQGFGNVNSEYWLGNDNLHQILSMKNYKLRIDLEDWNCDKRYAEYDTFVVGSEETKYKLSITGYSGDADDSIINPPSGSTYMMNGMKFTTSDRDNDEHWFINCAQAKYSGWWFNWSTDANLNGIYYMNGQTVSDGVFWNSWHSSEYSLKGVSMKIKPY